jgi:hypothetical protein
MSLRRAFSLSHSACALSSLSKHKNEPLRITGAEAGPKMLAGLRCVNTLKKRVLAVIF